jgi:hypothetical protein
MPKIRRLEPVVDRLRIRFAWQGLGILDVYIKARLESARQTASRVRKT